MSAYLVLLLAVLSRLLPSMMHSTAANVTAVGASLLFFGARRSRWQALIAAAVMAGTDYYLTVAVYGMSFREYLPSYLVTWAWYVGVVLLGHTLLSQRTTAVRVLGGALGSATSFFVLSNGMVWLTSHMYLRSVAGLGSCYVAGLPFYRNDLASTLLVGGVLFGMPVLARRTMEMLHGAGNGAAPAA